MREHCYSEAAVTEKPRRSGCSLSTYASLTFLDNVEEVVQHLVPQIWVVHVAGVSSSFETAQSGIGKVLQVPGTDWSQRSVVAPKDDQGRDGDLGIGGSRITSGGHGSYRDETSSPASCLVRLCHQVGQAVAPTHGRTNNDWSIQAHLFRKLLQKVGWGATEAITGIPVARKVYCHCSSSRRRRQVEGSQIVPRLGLESPAVQQQERRLMNRGGLTTWPDFSIEDVQRLRTDGHLFPLLLDCHVIFAFQD